MKQLKVRIELITPEIAQDYLNRNIQNRKFKKGVILDLSNKMTSGKWKENGESFIFDSNGVLKDGQHRLKAIIKSKHSFNAVIVTGVDPDVMDTIDTGSNRTLSDVLFLNNFKSATQIAALTKAIIIFNKRNLRGNKTSKKVLNSTGLKYALKHQNTLYKYGQIAHRINQYTTRINTTSFLGLTLHLISKGLTPTDNHIEFIKRMAGVVIIENTGTAWFLNTLIKAKKDGTRLNDYWVIGILIKCYNLYVQGDPAVRYLTFDADKPWDKVL